MMKLMYTHRSQTTKVATMKHIDLLILRSQSPSRNAYVWNRLRGKRKRISKNAPWKNVICSFGWWNRA